MRYVETHDLELFAINTGELYERHKQLARVDDVMNWRMHVKERVVPLYCKQVEPVNASIETIAIVAAALQAYYEQHVKEMGR